MTAARQPTFRARAASSATFQMGTVAQGWLVYELTGSAFALGWVSSGWAISSLILSLYGGAIADRVDKRDLLIWTRLAMIVNTLVLAVLVSTGAIRLWHLVANSVLSGVLFSFMMPASQAIVSGSAVSRRTVLPMTGFAHFCTFPRGVYQRPRRVSTGWAALP